jgi:hypothetical protein
MWQAKRNARERAVTDLDDSANEKPARGERRHIYIASGRRKVTVRSEISFDDDQKKIHVRTDAGSAGWAVNSDWRWKRWSGNACFHRRKKATELADILCGATLKLPTQSAIDGSIDGSLNGWIEMKKRTVQSDEASRSFRKHDL